MCYVIFIIKCGCLLVCFFFLHINCMSLGSTNQKVGQVSCLNAWHYADGKFAITICFFGPFSMKEQCLESKC